MKIGSEERKQRSGDQLLRECFVNWCHRSRTPLTGRAMAAADDRRSLLLPGKHSSPSICSSPLSAEARRAWLGAAAPWS
jgi:hypothetical protein